MNFRNRVYKLQCGEIARLPVHIVGSPASHDKSTASKRYIPPPSNAIHEITDERWNESVL